MTGVIIGAFSALTAVVICKLTYNILNEKGVGDRDIESCKQSCDDKIPVMRCVAQATKANQQRKICYEKECANL